MYQKGDIVLLPFPFTDLSAVRTRPAVVVSVEGFQRDAGDFTVAMITSVPRTTVIRNNFILLRDTLLIMRR